MLGTGSGGAGQTYALASAPVIPDSLRVEVEEPGGWTPWTRVDDFAGSWRDDRVFTLDPEAGSVRFGDGQRGRVPQIGERIRAREYRFGGGAAGNVGPKAITRVVGVAGVRASNPRPAFGGEDAEAVGDAVERIPAEMRRRDRAVTREDFRDLALATPGAGVGRAEVLALFHPPTLQEEAAGVVTVVVWPREDAAHPDAPLPDRDLLRCVCAWLDARRLVTTELYVVPPTYRRIAVSVGVKTKPGFGVEAVRAWVELVVRQYLAPLPPYGPAGEGWPLGRRVHGPELEAAALQVEGVEYLEGLRLAEWGRAEDDPDGCGPQTVLLEPYEVPELAEITVVEGPPLAPGAGFSPPPALDEEGNPQEEPPSRCRSPPCARSAEPMRTLRPFALVQGGDAWSRAAHDRTFLELETGTSSWRGASRTTARPPRGRRPWPAGWPSTRSAACTAPIPRAAWWSASAGRRARRPRSPARWNCSSRSPGRRWATSRPWTAAGGRCAAPWPSPWTRTTACTWPRRTPGGSWSTTCGAGGCCAWPAPAPGRARWTWPPTAARWSLPYGGSPGWCASPRARARSRWTSRRR